MIKGNTVIFNDEYISEIQRHIDNTEKKYFSETMPDKREILEDKLHMLNRKLEKALDFRENIEEILDVEVARLTAVKTTSGLVLPLKILTVI